MDTCRGRPESSAGGPDEPWRRHRRRRHSTTWIVRGLRLALVLPVAAAALATPLGAGHAGVATDPLVTIARRVPPHLHMTIAGTSASRSFDEWP